MSRTRVTVVAPDALFPTNAGGRAAVVAHCRALRAAGHSVDLVVFHREPVRSSAAAAHRSLCGGEVVFIRRSGLLAASAARPGLPYQVSSRLIRRATARRVRSIIGSPDVVIAEQEWCIPAAYAVGGPHAVLVLASHNDEERYYADQAASDRGLRRLYLLAELLRVRRIRRRLLEPVRSAVLLTDEDRSAYPATMRTTVIAHPLPDTAGRFERARPLRPELLFVGALDMPHAVEGLLWFVDQVLPEVRALVPEVRFVVAGRRADARLSARLAGAGVHFLGEVDDTRPLYGGAAAFVNPVFTGSGINVKVAEPAALGVPVLTTTVGARGYAALAEGLTVANTVPDFTAACVRLLTDADENDARSAALLRAAAQNGSSRASARWGAELERLTQ